MRTPRGIRWVVAVACVVALVTAPAAGVTTLFECARTSPDLPFTEMNVGVPRTAFMEATDAFIGVDVGARGNAAAGTVVESSYTSIACPVGGYLGIRRMYCAASLPRSLAPVAINSTDVEIASLDVPTSAGHTLVVNQGAPQYRMAKLRSDSTTAQVLVSASGWGSAVWTLTGEPVPGSPSHSALQVHYVSEDGLVVSVALAAATVPFAAITAVRDNVAAVTRPGTSLAWVTYNPSTATLSVFTTVLSPSSAFQAWAWSGWLVLDESGHVAVQHPSGSPKHESVMAAGPFVMREALAWVAGSSFDIHYMRPDTAQAQSTLGLQAISMGQSAAYPAAASAADGLLWVAVGTPVSVQAYSVQNNPPNRVSSNALSSLSSWGTVQHLEASFGGLWVFAAADESAAANQPIFLHAPSRNAIGHAVSSQALTQQSARAQYYMPVGRHCLAAYDTQLCYLTAVTFLPMCVSTHLATTSDPFRRLSPTAAVAFVADLSLSSTQVQAFVVRDVATGDEGSPFLTPIATIDVGAMDATVALADDFLVLGGEVYQLSGLLGKAQPLPAVTPFYSTHTASSYAATVFTDAAALRFTTLLGAAPVHWPPLPTSEARVVGVTSATNQMVVVEAAAYALPEVSIDEGATGAHAVAVTGLFTTQAGVWVGCRWNISLLDVAGGWEGLFLPDDVGARQVVCRVPPLVGTPANGIASLSIVALPAAAVTVGPLLTAADWPSGTVFAPGSNYSALYPLEVPPVNETTGCGPGLPPQGTYFPVIDVSVHPVWWNLSAVDTPDSWVGTDGVIYVPAVGNDRTITAVGAGFTGMLRCTYTLSGLPTFLTRDSFPITHHSAARCQLPDAFDSADVPAPLVSLQLHTEAPASSLIPFLSDPGGMRTFQLVPVVLGMLASDQVLANTVLPFALTLAHGSILMKDRMLCVLRMFVHGTLVTRTSEVTNLQTQRVTCKQVLYTGPRVVANVSVTLDGHPLVATNGQPTMLLADHWNGVAPEDGGADGGYNITVTGQSFDATQAHRYYVRLADKETTEVTGPPLNATDSSLTFAMPPWRGPPGLLVMTLLFGSEVVTYTTAPEDVLSYSSSSSFEVFAAWQAVTPTRISAGGPQIFTFRGVGFDTDTVYHCQLRGYAAGGLSAADLLVPATAAPPTATSFACEMTSAWTHPAQLVQVTVISRDGAPVLFTGPAGLDMVRIDAALVSGDTNDRLAATAVPTSGAVGVTVDAIGLTSASECTCRLIATTDAGRSVATTAVASDSSVACDGVAWPWPAERVVVLVTCDGQVLSPGPAGTNATVSLQPFWSGSNLVAARATGGQRLVVAGGGFSAGDTYTCRFEGGVNSVTVLASVVNMSAVACIIPEWVGSGRVVDVAIHSQALGASITGTTSGGDTALTLEYLPTYVSVSTSETLTAAGGGTLQVHGAGFDTSLTYACVMHDYTAEGVVATVSDMTPTFGAFDLQCTAPQVLRGACMRVSVVVDALGGAGTPGPIEQQPGDPVATTVLVHAAINSLTPVSVTTDGEVDITIDAVGLDPAGRYACLFKGSGGGTRNSTGTRFPSADGTSLVCRAPPWPLPAGGATVSVYRADGAVLDPDWVSAPGCSVLDDEQASIVLGSLQISWLAGSLGFTTEATAITSRHAHVSLTVRRTVARVGQVVGNIMHGQGGGATLVRTLVFKHNVEQLSVTLTALELRQLAGVPDGEDRVGFVVRLRLEAVGDGAAVNVPSTVAVAVCGRGAHVLTLDTASPQCVPCPAGSYASGDDVTQCSPCPRNTYSPKPRTVNCTACPPRSSTAQTGAASVGDCRCQPVGFFRAQGDVCQRCDPSDADAVCVLYDDDNQQVLARGWWLDPEAPVGGPYGNESGLPPPLRCPENSESPCSGGSSSGHCVDGYTGYLCTSCSPGYYRRANTCQVCPTYAATLVAVGVPLIVFGVVLALLFMPLANSRMSTFGLIVNLTQFIGMSAQQNVDWPAELDPFFELFSFTNLNIELVSPDCLTKMSVERRLRVYLGLPAMLLGMVWFVALAVHAWAVYKARRRATAAGGGQGDGDSTPAPPSPTRDGDAPASAVTASRAPVPAAAANGKPSQQLVDHATNGGVKGELARRAAEPPRHRVSFVPRNAKPGSRRPRDTMIQRALRATVIICFVAYLTVSKEAIGSFTCIAVGSNMLLARDVSVNCDSEEYQRIWGLALAGVLTVAIGVFVLFGAIIFGAVRNHKTERWHTLTFGVLYATYKPSLYWWEMVVMTKRLAIVLADGLVHPDLTPFKFSFFVLILITYLLLLAVVVPFRDPVTNLISLVFNVVQFLIAFGGVLFFFTTSASNSDARKMMTGVLLVVFVAVIGGLVSGLAMKVWQAGQRRRLKRAMKAKFGDGNAAELALNPKRAAARSSAAAGSKGGVELTTVPFSNPMHSTTTPGADGSRGRAVSLPPSGIGATRNPLFERTRGHRPMQARSSRGGRRRASMLGRRRSVLATFTGLDDDDAGDSGSDDSDSQL